MNRFIWELAAVVYAADPSGVCPEKQFRVTIPIARDNGSWRHCYNSFTQYFQDFITLAINLAFILAFLIILFGAIKYISSSGDETKMRDAKDMIIGALIGFALLVLIKVIVPILGID